MSGASRELRIAPVMTGGTSLAVWMGGVTAELYTMLRSAPADWAAPPAATDHVYTRLLWLTETEPVVDVITGTSAGGLNGVLLAAAWRLGITPADFHKLRRTWMQVADLDLLIRSPRDPNPPSLLKGDAYFVPNVVRLLEEWIADAPTPLPPVPELDLVTTVTTLVAEPKHRRDHFGEAIDEVSHAQWLRFRTEDFAQEGTWAQKLAIAARTSASIPGVFEPSYLPVTADDAKASRRPSFKGNASFTRSRWAVDGGVVVNLPLTEALERIFERPAGTDVRRVALYVSPTPGSHGAADADRVDAEPDLRTALLSAVLAPRAEGIANDIDVLDRQNATVDRQARARTVLGPMVDLLLGQGGTPDARSLVYDLYQQHRTDASVAATLAGIQRRLQVTGSEIDPRLRPMLRTARAGLYPEDPATFEREGRSWGWGIRPIEQAVSIAVRLITRARSLPIPLTDADREALGRAQDAVYQSLTALDASRELDGDFWEWRYETLAALTASGSPPPDLAQWAVESYDAWPEHPGLIGDVAAAFDGLYLAHRWVAWLLVAVGPTLAARAAAALALTDDEDARLAGALVRAEVGVLHLGEAAPDVDDVQRRLLALHIAQTAVLGEVLDREQPVELMQVSFNSRNHLDPDRSPTDKLAGPELGRLGAFLKPSWRANDWTWGRMDGASRLVQLLADPQRIRRLHPTRALGRAAVAAACGVPEAALPEAVRAELDGLYTPAGRSLTTLPALVEVLSRELQTAIACEELPAVARSVEDSRGNEIESRRFKKAFDDATAGTGVVDPADAAQLVQQMRIGTETVRTELGFPALNRLVTRASSVAVNAITGTRSGLPVVPRLLRPVRGPFQAVASLVSVMVGDSPVARAATAFVLAVAGAIVSLRLVGVDVPAGSFAISALLLTLVVVAAMVRSGATWLALCVLAGSAVVGLALAGEDLATVVYDTPETTPDATIRPTSSARFEGPTSIRVREGTLDDRGVTDIEVPDGASVEFNDPGVLATPSIEPGVAGWKRWGFLASPVNVFAGVTVGAGLLLLLRSGMHRRRFGAIHLAGRVALGGALLVAGLRSTELFEPVLRGGPGERAWKDDLVTAATDLEGYGLEVTLLVIVGASLLLALGTDLVFSRMGRRAMAWLRRSWLSVRERLAPRSS